MFNSFVVNFLVRLRVTTHVTTAVVEALPLPRSNESPSICREIAALARSVAKEADEAALARLQALVAQLYQLNEAEFAHVLDSFPLVARGERDAAMTAFVRRC